MIQILLLAILLLLAFYGLQSLRKSASEHLARRLPLGLLWLGLGLAVFLLATGRLGWVAALVGASIAALTRLMPLLVQLLPLLQGFRRDRGSQEEGPPKPGSGQGMSREEALQVLGLETGATRQQIVDTHRRLMQKIHPDRGGSAYLAAKLNKARDVLLAR